MRLLPKHPLQFACLDISCAYVLMITLGWRAAATMSLADRDEPFSSFAGQPQQQEPSVSVCHDETVAMACDSGDGSLAAAVAHMHHATRVEMKLRKRLL
jgi:hypothetical protein